MSSDGAEKKWEGAAAVDVYCGRCDLVLYTSLRPSQYVFGPPLEAHMEYTLYTDVAPIRMSTVAFEGNAKHLTCLRNCMGWKRVFLVRQAETTSEQHGYTYALACGRDLLRVRNTEKSVFLTTDSSLPIAMPSQPAPALTFPASASILFQSPPGVDLQAKTLFLAEVQERSTRQRTPCRRYDLSSVTMQEGICGGFCGVPIKRRICVERDRLSDELRILLGNGHSEPTFFASLTWEQFCGVAVVVERLFSLPLESPTGGWDIYGVDIGIKVEAFDTMGLQCLKTWHNQGPSGCCHTPSTVEPTKSQKAVFQEAVDALKALVDARHA